MITKNGVKPLYTLFKHQRNNLYTVLEDMDFSWKSKEVKSVIHMWWKGWSLSYIADQLQREVDEVAVLILDLGEYHDYFPKRMKGIHVNCEMEIPNFITQKINRFLRKIKDGYTAFDEQDEVEFIWDEKEVCKFDSLWTRGLSFRQISNQLKRNVIDVILLIIDRTQKGYIQPRKGGLDGWESKSVVKEVGRKKDRNKSSVS